MGKASWFEEPSGSVINLDPLFVQVEVMASRLCGILIKSFDITLCPNLALTSITFSSLPVTAPTLPEPPGTSSGNTQNHNMACPQFGFESNIARRNPKKPQLSATKADNCSRSDYLFSKYGRDSSDFYQPPYSLHVQREGGGDGHKVLTRNALTDGCDAICTSWNYEDTFPCL